MLILSIVTYKFYKVQFPILLNIIKMIPNINTQKVLGNFWKSLINGDVLSKSMMIKQCGTSAESSEACIRIGYIVKIGFHISRERIDFPINDVGTI